MKLNNIIFLGTPAFAVPTLQKLAQTKYKPKLVITKPDRPKGRKRKLQPPPVKIAAENLQITSLQPEDVNNSEVLNQIEKFSPDIIVTVAYGGFLKKKIRKIAKFGCINLHPSLLPKYRGAAPINYALFNGEKVTGNTIFKIVTKMDAGPILYQRKYEIELEDCFTILQEKLAQKGAEDVLKTLELIENDEYKLIPQVESQASYTKKIEKSDLLIDWNKTAIEIHNKVRGLAEKPAAITKFRDKPIKIIETTVTEVNSRQEPGTVVKVIKKQGIEVATADKNIILKRVQPAGKKIMSAFAYSLGLQPQPGEKF
ncbi:MAG: methionyl-tRNA formyltransferase [Candidatus Cloacimonadota bacterium]|jgi:methionyl-tRNA formyltransferase|nr:methionyl-tRNA formyltransferase [Candidatus Cloacimonadota bacterium]